MKHDPNNEDCPWNDPIDDFLVGCHCKDNDIKMTNELKKCSGCGHPIGQHYKCIDKTARCMHVDRGVSNRGLVGMPWETACDCVDGKSEHKEQKNKEQHDKEYYERVFGEDAEIDKIIATARRELDRVKKDLIS